MPERKQELTRTYMARRTGELRPLVSSVRIEMGPAHDVVHVWNRGGKAGTLTVDTMDGERIAALLLPVANRAEDDNV